jgi:hydroxyacylglutathione hydrolase
MIHEILTVGALQCNCSIFGDETTHEAIVIDPGDGDDVARVLSVLARRGLKLKAIVITHAHIDHIGGAAKLKAATGAPVYMNAADQGLYDSMEMQAGWLGMPTPQITQIDVDAHDGDTLHCGATELQFLHTPGHTQGSLCVLIPAENKLIAGDTLFHDSIGRTDLPGGDPRAILRSIHTKLLTLDDATNVIAGHGPETTIGRERALNPFLS